MDYEEGDVILVGRGDWGERRVKRWGRGCMERKQGRGETLVGLGGEGGENSVLWRKGERGEDYSKER